VGCSSSSACTAVGSYDDGSSTWALAERWNGTSWSLQSIPRPTGAITSQLSGVACVTSTFCLAVGSYVDGTGQLPLAAIWNGTSWSLTTVPIVSGSGGTALSAVTCASTTACTVVGSYISSGTPLPTAASYNGSRWTLQSVPTPRNAAATFLSGLSCTSSSACTTVGYATDSLGNVFAVAERWNGTSWSEQTLAAAPSGSLGSALASVSCTSTTFCNAVGYYIDRNNIQRTHSQTWTPWTVAATVDPSTFDAASLSGIACTSSTACVSVGYFSDVNGLHTWGNRWQ